jgi:hypothetical protein
MTPLALRFTRPMAVTALTPLAAALSGGGDAAERCTSQRRAWLEPITIHLPGWWVPTSTQWARQLHGGHAEMRWRPSQANSLGCMQDRLPHAGQSPGPAPSECPMRGRGAAAAGAMRRATACAPAPPQGRRPGRRPRRSSCRTACWPAAAAAPVAPPRAAAAARQRPRARRRWWRRWARRVARRRRCCPRAWWWATKRGPRQ